MTINGGIIGTTNDSGGIARQHQRRLRHVTIDASITKTTDGNVVDVSGHSGGTISFSGAINATGVGTGITLVNNTSGAINFTNAAVNLNTGNSTALNFTNTAGTGAAVTFSGGTLNIDTNGTSGIGINATSATTGAGTLTIGGVGDGAGTAGDNVIDVVGGGRAIIINGVTTNAQFEHVSNAGGGGTAIFVRNNGATGSFEITGEGTTDASGGIIALTAGGGAGASDQRASASISRMPTTSR